MNTGIFTKSAKIEAACFLSVFLASAAWASGNDLPRVIRGPNGPVLELPEQLAKHIKVAYPDLRVPSPEDLTGPWAAFHRKEEVPYACWGDFNGDGKTDVALILLDGPRRWRLLAFNQTPRGDYVDLKLENFPGTEGAFTQNHAPQEFHLLTVKAGEKLANDHHLLLDAVSKFDAIGFFLLSDPASGFFYQWTEAADSPWPEYRRKGFFGVSTFGSLGD